MLRVSCIMAFICALASICALTISRMRLLNLRTATTNKGTMMMLMMVRRHSRVNMTTTVAIT